MLKHATPVIIGLCTGALLFTGCASKWSLAIETAAEPPHWRDDANTPRAVHLRTIKGFKETGTSLPNILKYIAIGRTNENNMITRPVAAVTGRDKRIAIADMGCACVHLYVPSEQRYRKIYGAGQEELRAPVSVAFDDESRLYVSDSSRGAIYVFDQAGEPLFSIRTAGSEALRRPTGLSYSAVNKILYVVDTAANKVHAFNTAGSLLFSFGGLGEDKGKFNYPTHLVAAPDGNLIEITYETQDPDAAIAVANAIAEAYQETRRQDAVAYSDAALEELDRSLAAVDEELSAVRAQIAEWTASNPARSELERRYQDALARLISVSEPGPGATVEERDAYRAELDNILTQLQTLQLANSLQPEDPDLAALVARQAEALDRRSQLAARRDQLEIDARLASSGVVLYAPARFAEASGISRVQTLLVAIVLGGVLGVSAAYFATVHNRWIGRRDEPEMILGAPLLAEIPDFTGEGSKSALPVRDDPTSASAEAFRFAAATLEVRFSPAAATPDAPRGPSPSDESQPRLFVVTSAGLGEGKTVVTANTAIAAARRGSRVLVIDGDLEHPALTRLMLGLFAPVQGFTDVVDIGLPLSRAVATLELSDAARVDVLSRGLQPVSAPDFFRSTGARELFETVRNQYDLVLIDSPPLLEEAYASTLVGYADRALVVVPHRSPLSLLEDQQDRLTLIGTPLAGYVYNHAPRRPEMAERKAR